MSEHPAPARRAAFSERVALPGRETTIGIGPDLRLDLGRRVRAAAPAARRLGVVVDARVAALWPLETWFDPSPLEAAIVATTPRGEAAKTREVLARVQDELLGLSRDEPVVVVGGGATLDVGGFAAATVRRGLPWVAVPTTVVGMADAAVGGKVAINHPRGKNLLGTFHPPRHVLADLAFLETLPARDRVAGLAELYKAARVGDPPLRARLEAGPPEGAAAWAEAVARAVAVKARLVEEDERDRGRRRLLNYGHGVGHALERVLGGEAIRHGEAVAIGMVGAGRIAAARGLWSAAEADRQRTDLQRLGLPTGVPAAASARAVLEAVRWDKKRRPGAAHVFVLPTADGLVIAEDVTDAEVRAALGARAP